MVTPWDLERFLARPGHINNTRVEDFHFLSLQAHHHNLVQPARPQSVPPFHTDTPRSSIRVCPPMQCDPRIYQFVLVDKPIILRADGVEVARNDPATASGLAEDISICWVRWCSISPSESRCTLMRRNSTVSGAVGEMMSTQSASLLYLLGSVTRETHPRMNFFPPSIPLLSFCESRPEAKRSLDNNVMVVKGMSSNDVWSSASVARKAVRTSTSPRRETRTLGVTSWRKMISGGFGPLRIWSRMSLARETGREEKASMFYDMRESLCIQKVSTFRDVRESLCHLALGVLQRYGCPASGGAVEGRKSTGTPESIGDHGGVEKRETSGVV
jgi:hypothetical protein